MRTHSLIKCVIEMMAIKRICETCGIEFMVYLSRIKQGRGKYCSQKCQGIARSKIYVGEKCPSWKGGGIEVKCGTCGKTIMVYHYRIKKGRVNYCSKKCMGNAYSKNNVGENHPGWKGGKIRCICLICKKEFMVNPSVIKKGSGKYCSIKCMGIAQSTIHVGENSPNWQGGISFEPYCTKFNDEFRQYIRDKFDNVCFLCCKTEEENGRKLDVHHVNYQKSCGCADTEEDKHADDESCQFVPLCISCNARVNGNRDYWERYFKNKLRNKLNGWYI